MQKTNIPQKQKEINILALPIEERNVRTTLNIQKIRVEGLARIGAFKDLTLTAMVNEAIKDYCAKMNNTQQIDCMIRDTNGFWSNRDLSRVTKLLPVEIATKMLPYQVAYLYCNLKDTADRERVFTTLNLSDELKQINALNGVLQKASIFDGETLKGFNIYQLAIDLQAKLTELQYDYLQLKLGADSLEKLKERRPAIFPEVTIPNEAEKEETAAKSGEAEHAEKQDSELTDEESEALLA